jgi:hypothetical protein
VENFHPAPPLAPAKESFSVKQIVFSYNALDPTPCFQTRRFAMDQSGADWWRAFITMVHAFKA